MLRHRRDSCDASRVMWPPSQDEPLCLDILCPPVEAEQVQATARSMASPSPCANRAGPLRARSQLVSQFRTFGCGHMLHLG